jgi:hypothetical protein
MTPRPTGARHPHHHHAFTGLWWPHGAAAVARQSTLFFTAYAAAGGQLDELTVDWEEGMWSPHYAGPCPAAANASAAAVAVTAACGRCARQRYDAIEADRRWPAARAELEALGFELNSTGRLADTLGRFQPRASLPFSAKQPQCSV